MPGQKTLLCALWLAASCAGGVEREALVVHISDPQASARAPLPPHEGAEEPLPAEARDLERERAEREAQVRAAETVANLRPDIERCFLTHQQSPKKRRVVVRFVLRGSGRVGEVALEPNLGDVSLRRCVRGVLKRTRFDGPIADGTRVNVPLELGGP